MKNKFILEFDEVPALIFVSLDGRNESLYIDGKLVEGWTGIDIYSDIDDVTRYELRKLARRVSK